MAEWPRNPSIYEIHTWIWLSELKKGRNASIDLGSVPDSEWDGIAAFGFHAVWLMGVWERSPAAIAIANHNEGLLAEFRRALPGFRENDNVGSPYAVRRYVVDPHLGGTAGLARAREQLAKRGIKLILDFVPNHVAPDHPWTIGHPNYFIRGSEADVEREPAQFARVGSDIFARGRDPYFPAWPDVLQLNAFEAGQRAAAAQTVAEIAAQCDGIRCDMAMLLLNAVFERTWGDRAGSTPSPEYWAEIVPAVKKSFPEFLFIAEAYWDMEWQLQQLGFDFCYDKRLYDRLAHGSPESVRLHLHADLGYQQKLLRFLENHDEPRAATIFPHAKRRAAAVTIATVPGAKLFHEGEFEGRNVKSPVFLGRRSEEIPDPDLHSFYSNLLRAIDNPLFQDGYWTLCECTGWSDNPTCANLIAWTWRKDDDWCVVIVNLGDIVSQGRVKLPWNDLAGKTWRLTDAISEQGYDRQGDELQSAGLYVELDSGAAHLLIHSASSS